MIYSKLVHRMDKHKRNDKQKTYSFSSVETKQYRRSFSATFQSGKIKKKKTTRVIAPPKTV